MNLDAFFCFFMYVHLPCCMNVVTLFCDLCSEGIEVMKTRTVCEKIPLSEVPFIMRALGFYPTEQEVQKL